MSQTEQKITKIVDGVTPTIQATVEQIGTQGALLTKSLGSIVPFSYDYIAGVATNPTTETYTYKSGGSTGTTVASVVVVYSDATKTFVTSVTRT